MRTAAAIILALGLLAGTAWADEDCRLKRIAALDMGLSPGRVTVPAVINGTASTLMIDTAGAFTMLQNKKAAALGLKAVKVPESQFAFYGGFRVDSRVSVATLKIGSMQANDMSYPVEPLAFDEAGVDGILGPDLLANYDVDFDFAKAKLNVFSKDHCPGQVVYWTKEPFADVPVVVNAGYQIILRVTLDGHDFKAVLDTGSPHSSMSLEAAERAFGIKENSPDLKPVPGSNGSQNSRQYPFKQMTFNGIAVNNPDITLVPDKESKTGECPAWAKTYFWCDDPPDIILGLSVLRQLHLYIAYREKKLYLTGASVH